MNSDGHTSVAASRKGRISRAAERFNQRALRLTRPGRHWLLTSARLGLTVAIASLLAAFLLVAAFQSLGQDWPGERRGRSIADWIVGVIIFAPLAKTGLILLVHLLTRRWLGVTGFVLVSTVLFAGLHVPTQVVPIPAAMLFCVMSYQYVSFRDDVGRSRAFMGVAACYAVNNSVAMLLGAATDLFGL